MSTNIIEPWEHILQSVNYNGADELIITANKIKECGKTWKGASSQFEPRLLAYQTSAAARPSIFQKYGLSIIPIENGTYLLSKSIIYKTLDYTPVEIVSIKRDTTSLILTIGNSETSLIDNLRYSGVFERPELLGEPITHGPLLNGRHRCSLDMELGSKSISIKGVQYETDSCFETANKILVIEGKSSPKPIDSFNIRQLYFPYREIAKIAAAKKIIITVFIHECKGIVHIWKYSFAVPNKMDSIVMDGHYMYKFSS
jgi:hypothetical protein